MGSTHLVSKDEEKQTLHSNIYRRLFLLSRGFQQWQTHVQDCKRNRWVDSIYKTVLIRSTYNTWKRNIKNWIGVVKRCQNIFYWVKK